MNDLIEVKNGVSILRSDIASQIAEFERVALEIVNEWRNI